MWTLCEKQSYYHNLTCTWDWSDSLHMRLIWFPAIMSKRPLPSTSTSEPNRKKSSFRFARNPSEVVANSTKVGQLASGRVKQTKQNTLASSSSTITAQVAPLPQDEPILIDDLNGIDALEDRDIAREALPKPKRKKRTNTTSVSNMLNYDHLI